MGKKVENKLKDDPVLYKYWELYNLCRTKEFVSFRKPGRKEGSEVLITAVFPTGFSILPAKGGLEDQSYMVVRLFSAAMSGEIEGFYRTVSKRS